MHYLVTGASGFVGGHLVRHLREAGHQVSVLVRRPDSSGQEETREVIADLLDAESVKKAIQDSHPDGVFHLAVPQTSVGASWQDPPRTIQENLTAVLTVLNAVSELTTPPRLLWVSSSEVLGDKPEEQPLNESAAPHPVSPYGLSKYLAEQSARLYFEQKGAPVITARPFNHIGPGQRPHFALPNFAAQIARLEKKGEGAIEVGNLSARRDFSDVRDVVAAYGLLMEKGEPGETYHIGSGTVRTIEDILNLLIEASPATIKVVVDAARIRPNDIEVMQADTGKLRALGWEPNHQIAQTVEDILNEARQLNQ